MTVETIESVIDRLRRADVALFRSIGLPPTVRNEEWDNVFEPKASIERVYSLAAEDSLGSVESDAFLEWCAAYAALLDWEES